MRSTQAMRDRIRELMNPEQDDYDRAVECVIDDLEALLAQPQSLTGCLHPIGPLSCQNQGKCQSVACNHYGKTECRPRLTVLAQVDGIVYPRKDS